MLTPKTQYFNGYRFTRGKEGTYYRCSKLKKRMHNYVWEYYNGKIPEGYEIHHIDLDKSNNDISNLQLLSRSEHRKLHANLLTDEEREWRRQNLNTKARPKAIEWHKSEEGRAWHRGLVIRQHKKKIRKEELICDWCGTHYIGERYSKLSNTYCSNRCRMKAYKQSHANDEHIMICEYCGKEFISKGNRPRHTCSNVCAERLRQRNNANKVSQENK